MPLLHAIREWRIDRMTDRVARRPHGRKARETYGADDAHSFAWEPVLAALKLGSDDRLLDVGCGGGVFLRHAVEKTGCTATGLDHSREMVRLARRTSGVDVVHGEADQLPFADGAFTAVSSLVAFFFFPDPVGALREMRRVLDPARGRLAVFTTAPEAKGTEAAPYPLATRGHFYADEELARIGRVAGLSAVEVVRTDEWAQLLTAQP
jgi:ubiquinone/menaquinone biosynthesis C-methylase UbiE